ncbi:MAG: glycine C-acetyltransferase [Planctomycetota bacterium]|jgi:glycine C-acetyltransferase
MYGQIQTHLQNELASIREAGLFKSERIITSPQRAHIGVKDSPEVLNLCANNYLGLSAHPEIIAAAKDAIDNWGYGLSSVRFICGTQTPHTQLEARLSNFLQTEDTILYSSCFDANGGLFETLLSAEDAVISDALNHASIIDGIRLCKAQRFRYANNDMTDLEAKLTEAAEARFRLIATDGVFSMDGSIAKLDTICDLADKHDAIVMVDDSHAVGFMGDHGRGTHEHCGVIDRVDILTGTLGKALGGASGGYISGKQEVIDLLRQRSRPYLFSNSVAPPVVGASLKALDLVESDTSLREKLWSNTALFRKGMVERGFDIIPGQHPITPIMIGDAALAARFADALLELGVYVIGFSYPVVPKGLARIRVQVSAGHSEDDLNFAMEAFSKAKGRVGL